MAEQVMYIATSTVKPHNRNPEFVDDMRKFITQGLDTPKPIKEATNEYREQSDNVGNFIKECLVKTDKHLRAKEQKNYGINNEFEVNR